MFDYILGSKQIKWMNSYRLVSYCHKVMQATKCLDANISIVPEPLTDREVADVHWTRDLERISTTCELSEENGRCVNMDC